MISSMHAANVSSKAW